MLPAALIAAKVVVLLSFSQTGVNAAALEDSSHALPRKYSIRWTADPSVTNQVSVEVSGLSANALRSLQRSDWKLPEWQRLLSVHADQGNLIAQVGLPPMLGKYRVQSGVLRFEPQYPLEPGVKYQAILRLDQLPAAPEPESGLVTAIFQAPARPPNPTRVVSNVYPSAELLPENLLKFYIHFSAPMSRGRIYDHIHLLDEAGKEIELPFLEIDEELWDPEMRRLTLFIDPGRIKRGVLPLEEVGPSLETGKRYTLVIDRAWKDGAGHPLQESFRKNFEVRPPDRDPPDPKQWKIQSPTSETREPLAITFPEPMDHALAQRLLRVTGESGESVEGKAGLDNQERRWTFIPARSWRRGSYRLVIPTTLEDLAGNNIGKPFEVDLFEGVRRRLAYSTVSLPFEVR